MNNKFFGGGGEALELISSALSPARKIRIATAFFEPSGFQCLMKALQDKEVLLLIGREEQGLSGVESIVREFTDLITAAPLEGRTEAMEILRNALARGLVTARLGEYAGTAFFDARYIQHHAKLYIADETACVVTSSNMSYTGLKLSREAGYTVT